ncbi:alpha-amylase family glycosyl hydrolase [Ornithobacterium rhinotracheale]|uniref:alpha-amylase family glycosyl hydrolase n=1 Tax=Ornithobacterium rhinotracheale TaxID=28251 RepID=UPI001FF57552|nr:alpha-amylase family glycosyl hydrolase [Ornithobacterium rhinotracheale]MCK0204655.1 alpha-amylase family glycosyl hydrolase [Ornithobacterium rhinotracheale]
MKFHKTLVLLISLACVVSCQKKENKIQTPTLSLDSLKINIPVINVDVEPEDEGREQPEWAKNAVIYEVNVRQFSKEGTLKAVIQQLNRIKDLGADVVWLMPIYPIGKKRRKGELGSYYAIRDYKKINPAFGKEEDLKVLVDSVHALGMKVLLDWVANHTSPDHVWAKANKDFYVLDSAGKKPIKPLGTNWDDVIQLNYSNPQMQDSMISAMQYWVKNFDIDGYRCDVAEMVPMSFWNRARTELDSIKNVFMLAEGEKPELYEAFNATYAFAFKDTILDIARGKKDFNAVYEYFKNTIEKSKPNDLKLYFTTNHDENSWNYTEQEMFGENYKNFTILTYAMAGIPLIYNGQEAGLDKRLDFFNKDVIRWGNYRNYAFFHQINTLHNQNPVMWNNGKPASFEVIKADRNTFQFIRSKDRQVLAFLQNYSGKPQYVAKISLNGLNTKINLLNNQSIPEDNRGIEIPPHQTIIIGQEN